MRLDHWTLVRFLHIAAAVLWVGGQLTLSLFIRPVAARSLDVGTRRELVTAIGERFGRVAAVVLFPVLLASGLALSYQRGVLQGGFGVAGYGQTLTIKVVLALASFALAAAHGMTATRATPRASRLLGLSGGLVSLGVVLLGTSLAW